MVGEDEVAARDADPDGIGLAGLDPRDAQGERQRVGCRPRDLGDVDGGRDRGLVELTAEGVDRGLDPGQPDDVPV